MSTKYLKSGSVFCELRSKSSELHRSKIQDQKITFQTGLRSWTLQISRSKITADQFFRTDQRSKIKRSLSEKITDQRRIKDQISQIKQIRSSIKQFHQLPGNGCILCLICWLLKTTSNATVEQTLKQPVLMKHMTWKSNQTRNIWSNLFWWNIWHEKSN